MQSWKPRIETDTNQHRWLHDSFKKQFVAKEHDVIVWEKAKFWEFYLSVTGASSKKNSAIYETRPEHSFERW